MYHPCCSCTVHCEQGLKASRSRWGHCSQGRYPSIHRCHNQGKHNRGQVLQAENESQTSHFHGPIGCPRPRVALRRTTARLKCFATGRECTEALQLRQPFRVAETRAWTTSSQHPIKACLDQSLTDLKHVWKLAKGSPPIQDMVHWASQSLCDDRRIYSGRLVTQSSACDRSRSYFLKHDSASLQLSLLHGMPHISHRNSWAGR